MSPFRKRRTKGDFPSFRGQTCWMDLFRSPATDSPVVSYVLDANLRSKGSLPEAGNPPNPAFAKADRGMYGISSGGVAVYLQAGLGFWPRFGQQPHPAPKLALVHQPPQPADAVVDQADGPSRPAPTTAVRGRQPFRRRSQAAGGRPSGQRRLPPWSHRPGPSGSPPIARANAGKSAPGRFSGSSAIANRRS